MPARATNAESKISGEQHSKTKKKMKEEKKAAAAAMDGGQQQHLVEHSLNGKSGFSFNSISYAV